MHLVSCKSISICVLLTFIYPLSKGQLLSRKAVDEGCQANLDQFDIQTEIGSELNIRCEAETNTSTATFIQPVFDLGFSRNEINSNLYVRGENVQCDQKRRRCSASFTLAVSCLKSFVKSDVIHVQCRVSGHATDSFRKDNFFARCENYGKIVIAKALKYGDICVGNGFLNWLSSDREHCTDNTVCRPDVDGLTKCLCDPQSIPNRVTANEVKCYPIVKLLESCYFTEQCAALEANAICIGKDVSNKTCQCNLYSHLTKTNTGDLGCMLDNYHMTPNAVASDHTGNSTDDSEDKDSEGFKVALIGLAVVSVVILIFVGLVLRTNCKTNKDIHRLNFTPDKNGYVTTPVLYATNNNTVSTQVKESEVDEPESGLAAKETDI